MTEVAVHKQSHKDFQDFVRIESERWARIEPVVQAFENKRITDAFIDRSFTGLKVVIGLLAVIGGLVISIRELLGNR